MKLTMWPMPAVLLTVGSLFQLTASVSLVARSNSSEGVSIRRIRGGRQAPVQVENPISDEQSKAVKNKLDDAGDDASDEVSDSANGGGLNDALQSATPCSCDCCQVQKMLPMEFVPQPGGEKITSQCWKAASITEEADATCPTQCQLAEEGKILSSAKGGVDYNRYCNYNCQPMTDAVGTSCIQFNAEYHKKAKADEGGNGVEVYPTPVLGIGSGFGKADFQKVKDDGPGAGDGGGPAGPDGGGPDGPKPDSPAEEAKALAAAKAAKLKIVYDMRKLVAERLRSEAGASVAAGAAAAERVRINEWSTKKNANILKKMKTKITQVAGKVEEHTAKVAADSVAADEAEKTTKVALADARIFAKKIVLTSRDLADAAIKEAVGPCSALAAKSRAEAKGLDKPEDWVKVVAARAANPYQKAVTDAVQRVSEYKNLADGLMGQAYGAQKQANSLIPHVNILEAQGDVIGATIEKKQVTDLLARARGLQDQAKGYWKTADDTRNTIPKWQMAAAQAAAYSAWEYANNAKAFR